MFVNVLCIETMKMPRGWFAFFDFPLQSHSSLCIVLFNKARFPTGCCFPSCRVTTLCLRAPRLTLSHQLGSALREEVELCRPLPISSRTTSACLQGWLYAVKHISMALGSSSHSRFYCFLTNQAKRSHLLSLRVPSFSNYPSIWLKNWSLVIKPWFLIWF